MSVGQFGARTRPEEVIVKLIELTQDGGLIWEIGNLKELSEERIESVFETTYKDRPLRLVERTSSNPSRALFLEPILQPSITLEIVSDYKPSGQATRMTLWTFPVRGQLIRDLLNAVKYQVAGVRSFFEDVLSEDTSTTESDAE